MSRLKAKIKKCQLPIILLFFGLLACPLVYKAWIEHQAKTKEVVQRETGLELPSGVEVRDAQVQLFSSADKVNYDWLLVGNTSLVPWARSIGRDDPKSGAAWERITTFQQICPFSDAAFKEISLHSVWRITGALPDKKATCFCILLRMRRRGC